MLTHQKIRAVLKKYGLNVGKYSANGLFRGDYQVTKYLDKVRVEIHNNGSVDTLTTILKKESYEYEFLYDYNDIVIVRK